MQVAGDSVKTYSHGFPFAEARDCLPALRLASWTAQCNITLLPTHHPIQTMLVVFRYTSTDVAQALEHRSLGAKQQTYPIG